MPWNKEGGDGNKGGPWGQGPWGNGPKRPQGGGRGPNQTPDLDEMLRRAQDKFRDVMPQGGKGAWVLPLVLLLCVVAYNSVYKVQTDERGVVLTLGKYTRTVGDGLRFAFWPIETLEKTKFGAVNQINFGGTDDGLMLAGDQNIVDIQFTVQWQIVNPEQYLFTAQAPDDLVRAVSESAMREVVGRTNAELIRTTGRQAVQDEVRDIIKTTLDSYQIGVQVNAVNLEKADPPKQVIAAFEEVQRAEQNQAQLINQADLYRNQRLRSAEGESAKLLEDAKAYKFQTVADAQGEAQRFLSIYNQYKDAKDVTRERMFLETMQQVLSQSNKVILGTSKDSVVPYLPLPAIQPKPAGGTQ
ncbi:FtsH protease activity modulator HflK [Aestuariivirga sp.]|uniref:FtsH protease activity modulator HflK n=1 Tax=Aestuariivirga sp. TaxID=2650926 RepID=UPI0039E23BDE